MPVYASTQGFADQGRHPRALMFIVGGHAVLVAAVMTAKMEVIPLAGSDQDGGGTDRGGETAASASTGAGAAQARTSGSAPKFADRPAEADRADPDPGSSRVRREHAAASFAGAHRIRNGIHCEPDAQIGPGAGCGAICHTRTPSFARPIRTTKRGWRKKGRSGFGCRSTSVDAWLPSSRSGRSTAPSSNRPASTCSPSGGTSPRRSTVGRCRPRRSSRSGSSWRPRPSDKGRGPKRPRPPCRGSGPSRMQRLHLRHVLDPTSRRPARGTRRLAGVHAPAQP